MEWVLALDRRLFLAINGANAAWLDQIMVVISDKYAWIPIYVVLLFFLYRRFGFRQTLIVGLACALVVILADQMASSLLKPWIGRLRPCHEPSLSAFVNLPRGKCGGEFGFVSSHAANFGGMAVFLGGIFFAGRGAYRLLFFLPVLLVAYSRVYLGVHYPADVLAGALLGAGIGWAVLKAFRTFSPRLKWFIHS